jgi:flavin-dependent dehydrogenase
VTQVDVLIVGGSLAGASCARELTRMGIDAVAFERDRFPREKVCGGFLSPGAVTLLEEIGMLDAVRSAGAASVRSVRMRIRGQETSVNLHRTGLGMSRKTLDHLMADHPAIQRGFVREVRRVGRSFRVRLEEGEVSAKIVIDASGKLSRFSPPRTQPQFGVQFYERDSHGDVLDFSFFEDGYGGAVTVEGGQSSACFLIYKDALPRYLSRPECTVTGPVSYVRGRSAYLAIGDAAGMVDPFCGEGMRHALDSGMRAARIVAGGVRRGEDYDVIRARYEQEVRERWGGKRRLGRYLRAMLQYPRIFAMGFRMSPEYWIGKLWE